MKNLKKGITQTTLNIVSVEQKSAYAPNPSKVALSDCATKLKCLGKKDELYDKKIYTLSSPTFIPLKEFLIDHPHLHNSV